MVMQPGDVVFIRWHTFTSALVTYFDPGKFTHAALAVSRTHILEIDFLIKARITPLRYTDFEIVSMGLTEGQHSELLENSINVCGTVAYDVPQAAWYAARRLLHLYGPNRWDSKKYYICTELIQRILATVGVLPPYETLGSMTPNEFYRFLTASPVPSEAIFMPKSGGKDRAHGNII